jgi:WhiB family redox-sensing transcriptional regulator
MSSPYTVSPHLRQYAPEPAQVPDDPGWQGRALCRQADPDAFFPEPGALAPENRQALRTCRCCPVRSECLEWAIGNGEEFGIWGGMTQRERRRMVRGTPSPRRPAERQSAHQGVIWDAQKQKWAARIRIDGSRRRLGFFTDENAAARAVAGALQLQPEGIAA